MCQATSFTDNSTALAETAFGRLEVSWSQRERERELMRMSGSFQLRSGFVIKAVEFLQLDNFHLQTQNWFDEHLFYIHVVIDINSKALCNLTSFHCVIFCKELCIVSCFKYLETLHIFFPTVRNWEIWQIWQFGNLEYFLVSRPEKLINIPQCGCSSSASPIIGFSLSSNPVFLHINVSLFFSSDAPVMVILR